MHRFVVSIFLFASVFGLSQDSSSNPSAKDTSDAATEVSQPVLDAEADLVKADWKSAQAKLNAWLAAHPYDARALFDVGYVADSENHLDAAASFYRRAIDANPKSLEAHLSLGLLLARQNKFSEARPELATATTLNPGEAGPELKARAWRALARLDRQRDVAAASDDLIHALQLSPETPEDTLLAAGIAEEAGQFEVAEAAYRRMLLKDPKSAPANAGVAHLLIARKQYTEAESLLRTALEAVPGDPTLNAQLATVLAIENKAEALPLLQKLHAAQPGNAAATRMLAEVMAEAGDSAGSDRLYVALIAATPNDAALLVAHGQNLTRLLKFTEAYAAFDKATQLDSANGDAWSGLAFAASRTSQPSVTIHALTMRSKYLPEGPSTYFLWAISYDALHEKKPAATYYHHFLDSSAGKFPNQEWQAKQRLLLLEK